MDGAPIKLKSTTELWRYMDLARFLALMDRKKLYFPRPHEFEDAWEGAWSPSDPLFPEAGEEEQMEKVAAYHSASLPLVSCWHENDTESIAMWKLYLSTAEGVAIKTTVSSLVQLFSIGRELKIGRFAYRDVDDIECSPEVFAFQDGHDKGEAELLPFAAPIFRKNRGYAHAAFAQSRPVTIETSILLDKPQIGKHQVVGNAP